MLTARPGAADPDAAADAQPRQRRRLALAARSLARRARRGRGRDVPARDGGGRPARRARAVSSASAPATRAAATHGEELGNFEPGSDLVARVTVLAEGTQGHLTSVALDHFGLRGDADAAGVGARREGGVEGPAAARPHDPHAWAGRCARRRSTASSADRSSTRWATTWSSIGMVVGLDYRDPALNAARPAPGAEDPPDDPRHPRGRRAASSGERRPSRAAGSTRLPERLHAPGLLLCGDGVGHGERPDAQGRALRGRVRAARRRSRVRGGLADADDAPVADARSRPTTTRCAPSFIWNDLHEVRDLRQVFGRGFFVGGALGRR